MIGLQNRTKRPIVINFDPAVYKGPDAYARSEVKTVDHNPKTGERQTRVRMRNIPGSRTILVGETHDFHDSIAHQADVAALLSTRALAKVPPTAPPAPAETPAPAAEPSTEPAATAAPKKTAKVKE